MVFEADTEILELSKRPELGVELDRPERAPYNQNDLLHVLFLKYQSAEQRQQILSLAQASPERQAAIDQLLDLYTCLFPKPVDEDRKKFTAMHSSSRITVELSAQVREAQERSTTNTWQHIHNITGASRTYLQQFFNLLIQGSVNGGSRFTAIINKKLTEFFPILLKSDHASAATNPDHAKDTITGPLGVFTMIDAPKLAPEIEGSQLEQVCDHAQKATFLMSLLYFQHMSKQGGFFNGAKEQRGIDPVTIQSEAKNALATLLTPDGIRQAVPNNPSLSGELIRLVSSPEFSELFPTLQGATHDLNTRLDYQPNIDKNYSQFTTTPFTTQGFANLLDIVPHRIFNGDSSRFADISVAQLLSYSPSELARIIRDTPDSIPWKNIAEIESPQTVKARWPIFATSITHESEGHPSPHTPYTASLGRNMLELDYGLDPTTGKTLLRFNQSHAIIDGMDAREYITLINTVLGRAEVETNSLSLSNAPLYPIKERPKTLAEHFAPHSDLILGRTYDYATANKLLSQINTFLDPIDETENKNVSQKIYDYARTELTQPDSIHQILSSLIYEYPGKLSLFSIPDSSTSYPGITPRIPELADIDPQDELQVLCLTLRHAYEHETARLRYDQLTKDGEGATFKSLLPLDQPVPAEFQTTSDISQKIISSIKVYQQYQELEIDEIAKEVRNNLCPRPSFIHILDTILATKRGGILNCTGMLSKHGRFGLSAVAPIPDEISKDDQNNFRLPQSLPQTNYNQLIKTVILNLHEQSRTRLGYGTPAFLAILTGRAKEVAAGAANPLNELLVRMTGGTLAQSSTLGKSQLLWFITANSAFNKTNGLAVGDIIRSDGITGALTYRLNLVKANVRRAFRISDITVDKESIIEKLDKELESDIYDTFTLLQLLARGPTTP